MSAVGKTPGTAQDLVRVVLLAPGVWEPLTEGRKLYVTDLAAQLRASGLQVEVLKGDREAGGMRAILQCLRQLRQRCASPQRPDGVIVFPYGTFTGARRWANELLLRAAAAIGRLHGVPTVPLFYSCAGLSLDHIDRHFAPCLAVGAAQGRITAVELAISRRIQPWRVLQDTPRRLLFLCGYQHPTEDALHGVLHERGLMDLLQAGDAIAGDGFELTVAIPFLRDAGMRARLQALVAQHCPRLTVHLMQSVDAGEVFSAFDAFVFPYHVNHAVFVPTSLLEAMTAGIPVVTADLPMYRALTRGPEGPRCGLYAPGDIRGLAACVADLRRDYAGAVARADRTAQRLRDPDRMARSAQTVLDQLSPGARAPSR
ncbi:glycosyltransferase [Pelomonas sp. APW6]|uniref:Glycosyltransferase n=1 Tax=Roseateles subflavus TaxID=3053353 RepID=A0ABT7LDG9_9BURK|nr:glycosyltransferase [Pelomonas sp. APW6]MDL5030907.1 glycosyltransferase [Pelomonas sp. APW6]